MASVGVIGGGGKKQRLNAADSFGDVLAELGSGVRVGQEEKPVFKVPGIPARTRSIDDVSKKGKAKESEIDADYDVFGGGGSVQHAEPSSSSLRAVEGKGKRKQTGDTLTEGNLDLEQANKNVGLLSNFLRAMYTHSMDSSAL